MAKSESVDDLRKYDFDILAFNAPWYNGIEILITGLVTTETPHTTYDFTLDPNPDKRQAGSRRDPTLILSREAGQKLINQLWYCGLRPSEVGSAGQLQATENHLADMRKLVFELLPTKDGIGGNKHDK